MCIGPISSSSVYVCMCVCVGDGRYGMEWRERRGRRRRRGRGEREGRGKGGKSTYDDQTEDQGIVRNVCDPVGAEAQHDDGEDELHGVEGDGPARDADDVWRWVGVVEGDHFLFLLVRFGWVLSRGCSGPVFSIDGRVLTTDPVLMTVCSLYLDVFFLSFLFSCWGCLSVLLWFGLVRDSLSSYIQDDGCLVKPWKTQTAREGKGREKKE